MTAQPDAPWVLSLADPRSTARDVAGGKGSSLARMAARGLPVPPGVVVTAHAFRALLGPSLQGDLERVLAAQTGTDHHALDELLAPLREQLTADLDATVAATLEGALRDALDALDRVDALSGLNDGPDALFAVRSSAVAEDSSDASFAGQYSSFLGVTRDAVPDMVRRCFASFLDARGLLYARARRIDGLDAAVVVQRLVRADAAGVCFSVDPVTGDATELVIDANWGLGESVVAGVVTPDHLRVPRADGPPSVRIGAKQLRTVLVALGTEHVASEPVLSAQACLTHPQARSVASLALQVEALAGHPVDIEWAVVGEQTFLLQSRPITSHPAPLAADFHPSLDTPIDPRYPLFSNGNISEVLPGCVSPLAFSTVAPAIDYGFRAQLRETGALIDDAPELRVIGFFYHRLYLCVSYLAEGARNSPGISPDRVYEEFVGPVETPTPAFTRSDLTPHGLLRLGRATRAMLRRLRSLDAGARHALADVRARHVAMTSEAARALSDEQLADAIGFHPEREPISMVHVWASTFAVGAFGALRAFTAKHLGDDGSLAADLVTGLGTLPSADPAFGLFELGAVLRASPALLASEREHTNDAAWLAWLSDPDRAEAVEFRARLAVFQATHGHRAVCEAEPRKPSWREDPTQVLALLRNTLVSTAEDPHAIRARQARVSAATLERALSALRPSRRPALKALVGAARRFIAQREQLKDGIVLRADRLRLLFREVARRGDARGWLDDPDDVYFLLVDELEQLLPGELDAASARSRVALRRREFARCERLSVPKLQQGVAVTCEPPPASGERVLRGLGVSPGRVEGVARVIVDPRQSATLHPGEVLVAPVTDAGWTPLFVHAAALVVDVGGLLSHGSVVAREYGLTAVVGVTGATSTIRTGDRVVVDGSRGTVTVVA